jgi:Tfp pilus assembly protein PilN
MERAIGQLQLPWDAVLREIEKSANSSVALLSVEAQGRSRTLRLTGEAKTMAEVVAYTRRLRESPLIAAANVTHHENKDGGPVSLIRFAIEASWNSRP